MQSLLHWLASNSYVLLFVVVLVALAFQMALSGLGIKLGGPSE